MKGIVEKKLFEIVTSDLDLTGADEVDIFIRLPNFQKVVFENDPVASQKKQSKSDFNSVWLNVANDHSKTSPSKDQKNTRISKKTYYRLDMMQSYSTNFMSNDAIIAAAVSYSSNHLAKFYRPDSGVGDDTEYKDYMEILQRTGRFLSIKETNNTLFHYNLIEYCYHPAELISKILWLFSKGPATLPKATLNKREFTDKILMTLLILLDPTAFENYDEARTQINKLLTKYNLPELDGQSYACADAATMLTMQFVEQGFNYQFFSDYGAYLLAQNKITLEKRVQVNASFRHSLEAEHNSLFENYHSFLDSLDNQNKHIDHLNDLLLHRSLISSSTGIST